MKRHRARHRDSACDVTVTPPDTDTDTETETDTSFSSNKNSQKKKSSRVRMPSAPAAPNGQLPDRDFWDQLKANPAYAGIDLDRESAKMDAWLSLPPHKHRKKTKKFIVNWLNKIDVPVATPKVDWRDLV